MMAIAEPPKGLSARTPLLLLPVHLQFRFMASELWVRIYPDQIAVNAHEAALTAQEVTDGQTYWTAAWSGDPLAAWRLLATQYSPQRAAWIARVLTPTNVSQQQSGTPSFPAVTTRATSWEQPATADLLPDAWTVVLVAGTTNTVARSTEVVQPLAVSLTPNGSGFPAGSTVDAGLQWIVDFDAAIAAGMALKIPLTEAQRSEGFDRLFVYGVRTASADVESLLEAHHYTDGLAFVAQGSPTNNTPSGPSGYSRNDPGQAKSFAVERQGPLTTNTSSDGARFASLTGIPLATFDHVAGADGTESQHATDMFRALWPSTLGYFLSQMMADVFTADQVEAVREYTLTNAYPRGPLSAFRVGRTPYGVLPVTSLQHYAIPAETVGAVETGLVSFVKNLWPTWLTSSASAPHRTGSDDPDATLLSILGMDASSVAFQGRSVLGSTFVWNLLNFLSLSAPARAIWWQQYQHYGRAVLDAYGYTTWNPRVIGLGFAERSYPITFPTVTSAPLSETAPLAADADVGGGQMGTYIDWLRTASVEDIQAEHYPGPKPTSLLYRILRQAVLIQYTSLASPPWQELELVGIDAAANTATPWEILARPSIPNPALTWAEYLRNTNAIAALNDWRASLERLAKCSTAELDRLLTETLDACSHRLDVWATAVATSLLQRTRASQTAGQTPSTFVGAYGWVEGVRPAAARPTIQGVDLASVQSLDTARSQGAALASRAAGAAPPSTVLQPPADNGGYILAPSAAQAATAAILRSGYLTHRNTSDANLLSIDVSSDRVRKALWLIAGVQQGQSLNALLGYLFEDGLSQANLDKYIQPFRDKYPIVGAKLSPSTAAAESVAASNVVDGLALRTAWDAGQLAAGGNWGNDLPTGADQHTVITVLEALDDYADALGDLSIAESVFQMVGGNYGGTALMDAISRGSRPPMPGVVDTPRGGIDITHRVALLLAGAPTVAPAWTSITAHPRAAAEPWLHAWMTQVLPDPSTVRCLVTYTDGGGTPHSKVVSLRDLDIGPLDVLALSDAEASARAVVAAGIPSNAQNVQAALQSTAGLPQGSVLFSDAMYVAAQLRLMVGSARALAPQDLAPPEQDATSTGGAIDTADLATRATAVKSQLAWDIAALTAAGGGSADAQRAALMRCSFYGVDGVVSGSSSGANPSLAGQVNQVLAALTARQSAAASAADADVFGIVFGEDFVVLSRFTAPSQAAVQSAFALSTQLVSTDAQAPARWLRQLTYVRPGASRLDAALSSAQALASAAVYPPALTLGQLPAATPDRWLALAIDPANPPAKGRVAFACVTSGDATTATSYAGLLIDEWVERIPTSEENASLAFHYDEPDARAPQALLLAVCPDNRPTWDDALLQAILEETLELAKIRTVDLASVQQVGQILPALYFALNLQGATVSTVFANLTEVLNATGLTR
jgi:hypothetical protein